MNWKNVLGEELFEKVQAKRKSRRMTIVCFVRLAVENFVRK